MSSESKKRKADCDTHNRKCRFTNGFALKWKGKGKGWMFFNSSQRMAEKEAFRKEVEMQPENKLENLTPPNKGPSYVPKKEVTIYIRELKNDQSRTNQST